MRSGTNVIRDSITGFKNALQFVLERPRRIVETSILSIVLFFMMLFATFPSYSIQMLSAGPEYWIEAVGSLWWLLLESEGVFGVGTLVVYAAVGGIALRVAAFRTLKSSSSGLKGVIAMLPGAAAVGCAGCGAGILGIVAGTGAIAVIPIAGPGLRVLGIFLFAYFLGREGAPDACSVSLKD